jgi:hypothetical protein
MDILNNDVMTLLNGACKNANIVMMKKCLDHKIKLTNKNFDLLIENYNAEIKDDVIEYNINKCLNLLIEYGYVITQENFEKLTQKYIIIPKWKSMNLQISDEIKKICDDNIFYPYEEVKKDGWKYYDIDKRNLLAKFRSNPSVKTLESLKNKYNINPDIDFLRIACSYYKNQSISNIITHMKIPPDLICIQNLYKNGASDSAIYVAVRYSIEYANLK